MGDTSCIDKQIWNFDVECSLLEIKGFFGNVFGKSFFFLNANTLFDNKLPKETLFEQPNEKHFSKN
jgi:hypothetical protein